MPRGARLDTPGTLHHIMIRDVEKGWIVQDNDDRRDFVSHMGRLAKETGTAVYVWVLMTNHEYGLSLTEAARHLGVSTSAVAQTLKRE